MKRARNVHLALPIAALLASQLLADMGTFPVVEGEIHEEEQTALILMDTAKKTETIILQTNVRSDKERVGVFFMPLPTKPDVKLAPLDAVTQTLKLVKERGLTCAHMLTPLTEINGGGGGLPPTMDGIQVVLHEQVGNHNITAVQLRDTTHFRKWAIAFMARNHVPADFDFATLEAVVKQYFEDDLRFFLFDLVSLKKDPTTMKPLAISFASEKIYYPLRVNRLYTGKSDVLLMVFTDVQIPRGRFRRIGFVSSDSIRLSESDRKLLGPALVRLLPRGPVQFQCFLLQDPRGAFDYIRRMGPGAFPHGRMPGDLVLYKRLRKEAMLRWSHDVQLSLKWGKSHNPDYRLRTPWEVVLRVLGLDEVGL